MFHNISEKIKNRIQYLEKMDKQDRKDATPRLKRLKQIPSETGKFISLLASSRPEGNEIGTSTGYSILWLSLALKYKKIKNENLLH